MTYADAYFLSSSRDGTTKTWSSAYVCRCRNSVSFWVLTAGEQCNGTVEDCYPSTVYAVDFMNLASTKAKLGVPEALNFTFSREEVWEAFRRTGDMYG